MKSSLTGWLWVQQVEQWEDDHRQTEELFQGDKKIISYIEWKWQKIEWKEQWKWITGCNLLWARPERDHKDHKGRQDDLVGQD